MDEDSKSLTLHRLAEALRCSPDVFTKRSQNDLSETLELLTLWMATEDRPTRMRALTVLRARTGEQADTSKAALILARALRPPGEVP